MYNKIIDLNSINRKIISIFDETIKARVKKAAACIIPFGLHKGASLFELLLTDTKGFIAFWESKIPHTFDYLKREMLLLITAVDTVLEKNCNAETNILKKHVDKDELFYEKGVIFESLIASDSWKETYRVNRYEDGSFKLFVLRKQEIIGTGTSNWIIFDSRSSEEVQSFLTDFVKENILNIKMVINHVPKIKYFYYVNKLAEFISIIFDKKDFKGNWNILHNNMNVEKIKEYVLRQSDEALRNSLRRIQKENAQLLFENIFINLDVVEKNRQAEPNKSSRQSGVA